MQIGRGSSLHEQLIVYSPGGRTSGNHFGLSLGVHAVDHFLVWVHHWSERGYLRGGQWGRNLEYEDSDLNESTKNVVNSQKKIIYMSNCDLDLKESRRNNRKDSDFMWKLNLKNSRKEGRLHYFSKDYSGFYREQLCSSYQISPATKLSLP